LLDAVRCEAAISEEFTPYKFHVSEDIYSSLILHQDRSREWKSYLHPYVESKMLSPQDLLSWTIQRFKYAGGSLDIFIRHSSLFSRGLSWPQRLMYASTFWSYLGALWNILFLLAPIVYLTTGIAPVKAYTMEFVIRILPFLLATELAFMVGTWGISGYRSKASYLSFFSVNLHALWTVLAGKTIRFKVTPKERQAGRHGKLVLPQIAIIVVTIASIAFALASWKWWHGHYTAAGLLSNAFWGLGNVIALSGVVRAAFRNHERKAAPQSLEDLVALPIGNGSVTARPAHPRIIPEQRIELSHSSTEPATHSRRRLSLPTRDGRFRRLPIWSIIKHHKPNLG
jgi:cellulose synthase (UDP-forming)